MMPTEDDRTKWTNAHPIPGRSAYLWIYDEWLESKPRHHAVIIEVGVALGKSLAYLCERLIAEDRTDVEVWAVDPWAGKAQNGEQQQLGREAGGDFSLYAQMMLKHAPKAFEMVRVLRLRSEQAFWIFDSGADLVVIDAAHDYRSIHEDISCWGQTLRRDGRIGGDDHVDEYPGVEKACREFFGVPGDGYEVRKEQGWGTWLRGPR